MAVIRNSIVLFLSGILVFFNSGIALNIHYCQGNVASVSSIFQEEEKSCGIFQSHSCEATTEHSCCEPKTNISSACCSDDVLLLQDFSDKVFSEKEFLKTKIIAVSVLVLKGYLGEVVSSKENYFIADYSFESNAPPLYQLYCNYTYFG